jgi:hypothetical protein
VPSNPYNPITGGMANIFTWDSNCVTPCFFAVIRGAALDPGAIGRFSNLSRPLRIPENSGFRLGRPHWD